MLGLYRMLGFQRVAGNFTGMLCMLCCANVLVFGIYMRLVTGGYNMMIALVYLF